ncbi:hypothetical protein FACS1894152_7660 [Bacilli bacterium]|nr:hypothetical protein FACS1894152_7660 [Bacilli bacterium]
MSQRKEIREGDVAIMADASIHKSMKVREIIESVGVKLIGSHKSVNTKTI